MVSLKLATNAAGLDAATAINVTSFNMEVAKNAEALYVLGSKEPEDIINKQFGVTGSIELYFENTTYRDTSSLIRTEPYVSLWQIRA
jgi:hypothetical protein